MSANFIVGQFFGLLASIFYLWIFLFVVHNAIIRLTPYNTRRSKAISSTAFLLFTGLLFSGMAFVQSTPNPFILPSHLFLLGATWAEYYQGNKLDRSNG